MFTGAGHMALQGTCSAGRITELLNFSPVFLLICIEKQSLHCVLWELLVICCRTVWVVQQKNCSR